jgi:hypothetical protein
VPERAFADIKSGKRPTAHFVQLYWLLASFFSTCAEVGAAGYVISSHNSLAKRRRLPSDASNLRLAN